jgi:hypothetical protein
MVLFRLEDGRVMHLSLLVSGLIFLFTALVVVGAVWFLIMEGLDRIESFKKRAPVWLTRFIESRQSFSVLFLLCVVLLIGDGYELLIKEIPEVPQPPIVKIIPPSPPTIVNTPPPTVVQPAVRPKPPEQPQSNNPVPPVLTGIRMASQRRIPSDDPKLPYGLEVVIQTDVDISPVAIAVICDGVIGKGDGGLSQGGAYTMTKQGLAAGHENVFMTEWKSPTWTPQEPIVVHLFSEGPIKATSVTRINYIWP